jgi:hypothetical protein
MFRRQLSICNVEVDEMFVSSLLWCQERLFLFYDITIDTHRLCQAIPGQDLLLFGFHSGYVLSLESIGRVYSDVNVAPTAERE